MIKDFTITQALDKLQYILMLELDNGIVSIVFDRYKSGGHNEGVMLYKNNSLSAIVPLTTKSFEKRMKDV